MKPPRATSWLLLGMVAFTGCGKTDRHGADGEARSGAPAGGTSAAGGATTGGSGGAAVAGGAGTPPSDCDDARGPRPGVTPFTRLYHAELNNTLRALLPSGVSEGGLPWLPEDDGEDVTGPAPLVTVDALHELAHAFALRLTEGDSPWLEGCDVEAKGEEACRDALAEPLMERAYRRPLNGEDRQELTEAFASGRKVGGSFASGMRAVVEVVAQSPDLVYLIERGIGGLEGDARHLTGYESAARLSYFLTASPPDAQLYEAARGGPFSAEELAEQAERILAGPSSRLALSRFYANSVAAGRPREVPELGLDAAMVADVTEASRRFVESTAFSGAGTFRALLTEPSAWTNGAMARFYGYTATGDAWQKVMTEPVQRTGLFTQPSFLALTSNGASTSAVRRATALLQRLLCYDVPAPPDNVPTTLPEELPTNLTDRARLEHYTSSPACQECHSYLNPVGFAFEHYDAVGKWRDTDNGQPVDASGSLDRTDAAGSYSNALGLMENLAESGEARACFVRLWLERAHRHRYRSDQPVDPCAQEALTQRFAEGDGEVLPLLRDVARLDSFRYRSDEP